MPLPVIANTAVVAQQINATGAIHPFFNVFCVHDLSGSATAVDIADKVADQYSTHLLAALTTDASLGLTRVTFLDGTSAVIDVNTDSEGNPGTNSGSHARPYALAQVVTLQTGLRGRSHRGRIFLPCPAVEDFIDIRTRQIQPSAVAGLQSAFDAFVAGLLGADAPSLTLQVLSRKLGARFGVTSTRVNAIGGMQRRRWEKVAHD